MHARSQGSAAWANVIGKSSNKINIVKSFIRMALLLLNNKFLNETNLGNFADPSYSGQGIRSTVKVKKSTAIKTPRIARISQILFLFNP
jgi:hypothetical protein